MRQHNLSACDCIASSIKKCATPGGWNWILKILTDLGDLVDVTMSLNCLHFLIPKVIGLKHHHVTII